MLRQIEPEYLEEELGEKPMSFTIRAYECEGCNETFSEIVQRKDKSRRKKCPICKQFSLEQLLFAPTGFVSQDAKTLGQQAERNTKKMGRYELEAKRHKHKQDAKAAKKEALAQSLPKGMSIPDVPETSPTFGKDLDKRRKIANMTPKQKHDYIMTGKE